MWEVLKFKTENNNTFYVVARKVRFLYFWERYEYYNKYNLKEFATLRYTEFFDNKASAQAKADFLNYLIKEDKYTRVDDE